MSSIESGWDRLTLETSDESSLQGEAQSWAMPEWLEPYRKLIGETGDQSVEELMNGSRTDFHVEYMQAARLMAVSAQIELLERLRDADMLLPDSVLRMTAHQA